MSLSTEINKAQKVIANLKKLVHEHHGVGRPHDVQCLVICGIDVNPLSTTDGVG